MLRTHFESSRNVRQGASCPVFHHVVIFENIRKRNKLVKVADEFIYFLVHYTDIYPVADCGDFAVLFVGNGSRRRTESVDSFVEVSGVALESKLENRTRLGRITYKSRIVYAAAAICIFPAENAVRLAVEKKHFLPSACMGNGIELFAGFFYRICAGYPKIFFVSAPVKRNSQLRQSLGRRLAQVILCDKVHRGIQFTYFFKNQRFVVFRDLAQLVYCLLYKRFIVQFYITPKLKIDYRKTHISFFVNHSGKSIIEK